MPNRTQRSADWFWSNVDMTNDCWLWRSPRKDGYGNLTWFKEDTLAHRVAFLLAYGDPGNLCVLHRCDNPQCVRPSHLFLGTRGDNNRDRAAKPYRPKSGARGKQHGRAKITELDVAAIRSPRSSSRNTLTKLAARLGITLQYARAIRRRIYWKHI